MKGENLRLISRFMQLGFALIIVLGLILGEPEWIPSAIISLIITFIPNMIHRSIRLTLPPELNFLIVLSLFLHTFGGSLGLYETTDWWDHITHGFSAFLVASLGFIGVVIIDKYADSIFLPPRFLSLFIFMLTTAFGVLWELVEFANDQLTGSEMQFSLNDTVVDLMFDMGGAFVVAALGPFYLLGTSQERFFQEMHLDRTLSEMKSRRE